MLLSADFLSKLDRLSFSPRHVRAGRVAGERRSTKRGTSVEFADYRDYARGDDLRRVDWNIYARLDRPFVKLFEEEEDLAVHILLDGSGSMDWGGDGDGETGGQGKEEMRGWRDGGRPWPERVEGAASLPFSLVRDENKWLYARRLAASLGYVVLTSGDQLTVTNLQLPASDLQSRFGPVRGRGHVLRLFHWLGALSAEGMTDLNACLRAYAVTGGRPGLLILLSDLFSPSIKKGSEATPSIKKGSEATPSIKKGSEATPLSSEGIAVRRGLAVAPAEPGLGEVAGYLEGLSALAARGHELAVVHVLSPNEVEPPLRGDLRLLDVETGAPQEVTIDAHVRALYRRRLAAWRDEIRAVCRARDVHYLPAETDTPFERMVLYDLRRVGLLR
jgi:hypothetical protein